MALTGLISIDIPDEVVNQVKQKTMEIDALIKPYYKELSTNQTRNMIKLGKEMLPFTEDCITEINQDDEFLPKYADKQELGKDKTAFDKADAMQNPLTALAGNLENISKAAGSDVMAVCLAYYSAVQRAAKLGQPNARAIYERLRVHFKGRGKQTPPAPPAA